MLRNFTAAALNRQVIISDENEGPVVNLAAWLGMTIMILCVIARVGSKWSVLRKWTLDDTIILTTMIFAIAHTVTISLMVEHGLGQPQSTLGSETIEFFERARTPLNIAGKWKSDNSEQVAYASQLLYIPALYLAKLSTLIYLRALSPDSPYAVLNKVLEAFVIVWGVGTEFAIAFQCRLPHPWAIISGTCFNMVPFWNTTGAFDILTDLAIIALPAYLVWAVKMPFSKKTLVFLIFGTRIIITPLTILRLYFLNTTSSLHLSNQILVSYHAYLATTIQLNLAILVACIPFLKPFMENLSTGGFASTLAPMDSSFSRGGKSKFSTFLSSYSVRSRRASNSMNMDSITSPPPTHCASQHSIPSPLPTSHENFHFTNSMTSTSHRGGDLGPLRPDQVTSYSHICRATPEESARSSIDSDRMIIKKRTEWGVREDCETPALFLPPNRGNHGRIVN